MTLDFDYVCAILCNEPHSLTIPEVAQLTPRQVRRVYFCERDDKGNIILPKPPTQRLAPKDLFVRYWRLRGLRKDLIEKLMADLQ